MCGIEFETAAGPKGLSPGLSGRRSTTTAGLVAVAGATLGATVVALTAVINALFGFSLVTTDVSVTTAAVEAGLIAAPTTFWPAAPVTVPPMITGGLALAEPTAVGPNIVTEVGGVSVVICAAGSTTGTEEPETCCPRVYGQNVPVTGRDAFKILALTPITFPVGAEPQAVALPSVALPHVVMVEEPLPLQPDPQLKVGIDAKAGSVPVMPTFPLTLTAPETGNVAPTAGETKNGLPDTPNGFPEKSVGTIAWHNRLVRQVKLWIW